MPIPSKTARIPQRTASTSMKMLKPCLVLILGLVGMATFSGCARIRAVCVRQQDPLASIPRPRFSDDPQVEEVVDHLNRNVQKLHCWRANSVRIRANNMPLSGTLAVEEGNHLRLVVHSIAGNEVDMGSNDDAFWIWAKRMDPAYVYCRHEQTEIARQTLGVPFEPQWLMQALGVAPLDTKDLRMQIDPVEHRARLVQPITTAHGFTVQKVILVDLVHGVILEHCIYDGHGQKIAQARLEEYHLDKESGVVLPRRVKLDWPQNQMSLVMQLGNVEVNPKSIPSQIWDMPRVPGVQMVDLGAESRPGVRIARNDDELAVQLMNPEEVTADDDVGRVRLKQPAVKQSAINQARNSLEDEPQDQEESTEPIEFQTTPIERPNTPTWYDE